MTLHLNGETREFDPPLGSLPDLLEAIGLKGIPVLVELNGEPVPRTDLDATALADGDRLEILRMVAGG